MKLREFGLLTDENIDSDVVQWLRQTGFDVLDVCEQKLQGGSDVDLLKLAVAENRLIVTHDSDFIISCGRDTLIRNSPLKPCKRFSRSTPTLRHLSCSSRGVRKTALSYGSGPSCGNHEMAAHHEFASGSLADIRLHQPLFSSAVPASVTCVRSSRSILLSRRHWFF